MSKIVNIKFANRFFYSFARVKILTDVIFNNTFAQHTTFALLVFRVKNMLKIWIFYNEQYLNKNLHKQKIWLSIIFFVMFFFVVKI